MFRWLYRFTESTKETKWFILNWAVYILLLILTTLYCYGRLDYVRSYKTQPTKTNTL